MPKIHHLLILSGTAVFCSLSISPSVSAQTHAYAVMDLGRGTPASATPVEYQCGGSLVDCPRWLMVANANGQMAFQTFVTGTGIDAYYWEPGMAKPVLAGGFAADESRVVAISSNGFVTGIRDGGFARGYRWSRTTAAIALNPIENVFPLGVNAAGVVVGQVSNGSPLRAVIWKDLPASNAPTNLDDLDVIGKERWQFQTARTISDNGVIGGVGLFVTDSGPTETHYFALVPITKSTNPNLLTNAGFEESAVPAVGPGWVSDTYRQSAAQSETAAPHSGTKNGACRTTAALDCGIYQQVTMTAGAGADVQYVFSVFAAADKPNALVGVNVNGVTARYMTVDVGAYRAYNLGFTARAGDVIHVWVYSPAAPGSVVIDDATLMLDEGPR